MNYAILEKNIMRSVLTIILIGLSLVLNAQKNKDYSKIDFVALLIPIH